MISYEISVKAHGNETIEEIIKALGLDKHYNISIAKEPRLYGTITYHYINLTTKEYISNKNGRPRKLTDEQIEEIKVKLKNGEYKARIGREYGVSYNKINEISKTLD